jgi:uncharacterized membrane protein
MAPFKVLWAPIEFIFSSPLGILMMIAISAGLLRLIIWREKMLAAKYSPEDKLRSSRMWSIILVMLLIVSGCAYYAVRLP